MVKSILAKVLVVSFAIMVVQLVYWVGMNRRFSNGMSMAGPPEGSESSNGRQNMSILIKTAKTYKAALPARNSIVPNTLRNTTNSIESSIEYLNFNDSIIHVGSNTSQVAKLGPVNMTYLIRKEIDEVFNFKSDDCLIERWNTVRTEMPPHTKLHEEWIKRGIAKNSYLYGETASLFAAFAHKEHITVTMTTENNHGKQMYCRYFDCKKNEILDQFKSVVFPESTVFCPRRVGAVYISLTETLDEEVEYPVPIFPRLEVPKHYFTVCMAPLYGEEPKFLQIAEFIEYYKLHGATFFHIYVRNVSDYDRVLLDDYVRTRDVEVIKMHDHYWREDWLWHNPQINDCHQRNVYFSKWTAFVDLDEQIQMKSEKLPRIVDLLNNVTDPNIANLHFRVQWVIKDQDLPARFINETQIKNEMVFRKYRNTSIVAHPWRQPKCIIRPERFAMMKIHRPKALYKGLGTTLVNEKIGVVRHYRNVQIRIFPKALEVMMNLSPFKLTDIPEWIKKPLTKAILKRVKWVYKTTKVSCKMKKFVYKLYFLPIPEC